MRYEGALEKVHNLNLSFSKTTLVSIIKNDPRGAWVGLQRLGFKDIKWNEDDVFLQFPNAHNDKKQIINCIQ